MPEEDEDIAEDEGGPDSPEKRKIKHTVEAEEVPAYLVLAGIFDVISLFTIAAPINAVIGKFTFTVIWLSHGVMPWSKKYWSWYLITFVCEFIPIVNLLPMFIVGELKMIAQSRIEDRLQRTTGVAQAAVQIAKFKARQGIQQKIAQGQFAEEALKRQQEMAKSLRFASLRTVRRTITNKMQGRDTKYQDSDLPEEEGVSTPQSARAANQNTPPGAFDGVNPNSTGGQTPVAFEAGDELTTEDDVEMGEGGTSYGTTGDRELTPSGPSTGTTQTANDNRPQSGSGSQEPPERMAA